jgi:hypothetical protein
VYRDTRPPSRVRWIWPSAAQRLTVRGVTRSRSATSVGVSSCDGIRADADNSAVLRSLEDILATVLPLALPPVEPTRRVLSR